MSTECVGPACKALLRKYRGSFGSTAGSRTPCCPEVLVDPCRLDSSWANQERTFVGPTENDRKYSAGL